MRQYTTTSGGGKRFWYAYDHLDRITGVELFGSPTEAYGYDDAGNITHMDLMGSVPGPEYAPPWVYAASPRFGETPARMTVTGGVVQQFLYDDVGRLMLREHAPGTPNAETSSYTYDSASRLIEVDHSDGSHVELWYDNDDQVVVEERTTTFGVVGGVSPTIERFGPYQLRDGTEYTRVLPHVSLENQQLRYLLGEPDGRTAWVLDASGGLISEQVSTVYGLEYDAAVWGGVVPTAGKWPLGGLHGAESDVSTGVMQFGARHITNRGDGMWMQPEPLLAFGMASGDPSKPLAYTGSYAMANTNMWTDRDGYFTVGGDGTISFNTADVDALNGLAEQSQQTGLESGAPIWQVTDASGAPTGEYVMGSPVDGTKDGYDSAVAGTTTTGQSQLEASKASAAVTAGVPVAQLKPAGLAHTHVDHNAGTPSVGIGGDVANLVGSAKTATSSDERTFMITVAAQPNGGGRQMSAMSATNSSRAFSSPRDAAAQSRVKANYPSHERATEALHSNLSYQAFELGAKAVVPK